MKITAEGRVTIPQPIREKLGITPGSEIEFVEEMGMVMLVKVDESGESRTFNRFRGIAKFGLMTDEILSLTRK